MSQDVVVATAASFALVLSFACVRAGEVRRVLPVLRWHALASAVALLAAAASAAGPVAAASRGAGGALLLLVALRGPRWLGRMDDRTGMARMAVSRSSLPTVAVALVLTALAVLAVAAAPAGEAGRHETLALGIAVTLVGIADAARPGVPALCVARIALLGDGLGLLGCAGPLACVLGVLLGPACLLAAFATVGRAGGLPARAEEAGGWS